MKPLQSAVNKQKRPHIGNLILVVYRHRNSSVSSLYILLGLKHKKRPEDTKRRRKKIGSDCWVPFGGGSWPSDKSLRHGAQRELCSECGLRIPLKQFAKCAVLHGYEKNSVHPRWIAHVYFVTAHDMYFNVKPNHEYVRLAWFSMDHLPFGRMLDGDKKWLPRLMQGETGLRIVVRDIDRGKQCVEITKQ